MANQYFNAALYLKNNEDLAEFYTVETVESHYLEHGAFEAQDGVTARNPAPWFNVEYYLSTYPDLTDAGLTAADAFEHFTQHGINEGRTPSEGFELNKANLSAYAVANADLVDALNIVDPANPTEAEQLLLAHHYYAHGCHEDRPGKPGEASTLTEALDALQDAQAAVDQFLVDVIDNAAFQAQFDPDLTTADGLDVGQALTNATGALAAEILASTSADFTNARANAREGIIADAIEQETDDVGAARTAVATVEADLKAGVKGALATAEVKRAALEAALEAAADADAALTDELAVFNLLNVGAGKVFADGEFALSTDGTKLEHTAVDLTVTTVAGINADGEWELDELIDADDYAREGDLFTALQANTDALEAQSDAEDALEAAVLQVVRLENEDNSIATFEANIIDVTGTVVTLDFADATGGDNAPDAQDYLDAVADLEAAQETQQELLGAITAYRAMVELNGNYDALVEARDDARAAIEESAEDGGLGILLVDVAPAVTGVADTDELFLFNAGADGDITSFGAEDLLFFGSNYTFVELAADVDFAATRQGSADVLEIFYQVQGANTVFYVENEAEAGRDLNLDEIATVELIGVSAALDIDAGFVGLVA